VIVTGVPTNAYLLLPTEWIQPHLTVVNIASFRNVDEEEFLKIPGVVYVFMVGKVTVAMLELIPSGRPFCGLILIHQLMHLWQWT
jgi:methylenetetrahydrofolate dehydrogenase (NAD+)